MNRLTNNKSFCSYCQLHIETWKKRPLHPRPAHPSSESGTKTNTFTIPDWGSVDDFWNTSIVNNTFQYGNWELCRRDPTELQFACTKISSISEHAYETGYERVKQSASKFHAGHSCFGLNNEKELNDTFFLRIFPLPFHLFCKVRGFSKVDFSCESRGMFQTFALYPYKMFTSTGETVRRLLNRGESL